VRRTRVVQSLLPNAIYFKDTWLGSLLSTKTTVVKYLLRSCVSVISFPPASERRLNNCAESALISGHGGKRMSFCSPFSNVLILSRAGFSSQTVKYLMGVFVRAPRYQVTSKVDFVQDLDGNGEIGIEEVSGSPLVHGIILIYHAQFKPLWNYVKVRYHSRNFSIPFNPSVAAMARNVRILRL
jgi:hypothetical protein